MEQAYPTITGATTLSAFILFLLGVVSTLPYPPTPGPCTTEANPQFRKPTTTTAIINTVMRSQFYKQHFPIQDRAHGLTTAGTLFSGHTM